MAVEYLRRQQDRLKSEFQLGSWPRYDYDQEAATLTFSEDGEVRVVADIEVVTPDPTAQANIKLLCGACYDRARTMNSA